MLDDLFNAGILTLAGIVSAAAAASAFDADAASARPTALIAEMRVTLPAVPVMERRASTQREPAHASGE